jgi:uncharacterized protein YciI
MRYAIICRDKPGSLDLRLANRADHLAYIKKTGVVEMAGPFLQGEQMVGSLVIVEAPDLAAAQAWAADDPYGRAGLFASVEVIEWKKVIG